VIAADADPDAMGFSYCDKAICTDIRDEEEMLRIAMKEKIDGVIHPCSEVCMTVMGRINDELGLSGVTREQALCATNKHLMRQAFEKWGAPSPKSGCFCLENEAWNSFNTEYPGDGILKPSRSSGSRGISKISHDIDRHEFFRLFDVSKSESRDGSVMLEEFIEGSEFSVEIIVWHGMVNVLAVTDKKTTGAPHFVELGHNQPSCFPSETVEKIKAAAISGVKALGVDDCACHAELKMQDGEPFIMEVGARMGGDFISTGLTRLSTGIDMVAAAVNCALGIEPNLESVEPEHGVCIRYFTPKPGRLVSVSNVDVLDNPNVYERKIYFGPGDEIPEVTSSLCRSGHVIVTGETPQEAVELAERLLSEVKFVTEQIP